ncbi:MAG: M48 family metallopeptidase [Ramlibacter sp.]|nr:M48 family metallopeptidase [Ramlibacter sp.]
MREHSVAYGDERIRFTIRRSTGRPATRVAIHVDSDGRVTVDAQPEVEVEAIRIAVKKRAHWISTHVDAARKRLAHVLPREYVSGEALHYLGRRYRLKVRVDAETSPSAALRGGFIEVIVREQSADAVRNELEAWNRERAREVFNRRLSRLGVPLFWLRELPPMRLQTMRTQWGSCSPSGRITLNPALVKAPPQCIDYVLLHELCHLRHHDHSPQFYRLLDRHMIDWRKAKEQLDSMAEQLLNR